MRVLVTGGGGFIGSHVMKQLLKQNMSVISYDVSPLENSINEVLTNDEIQAITSVVGDICDFAALCRVIQSEQVTHIVHLASPLIDSAAANPYRASQVMNSGMLNVLEAARIFDLKKIIWASSMSVFSSNYEGDPLANDAPHTADSVYGACKSWCEKIATHYGEAWGIDSVGLRFGVVYGPGRLRGPSRFATDLIRMPALGETFVFEYGNSVVDWQYIDDIANITVATLLADSLPERAYNVRGDEALITDVADIVRRYIDDAKFDLGDKTIRIVPTGDDTALVRDLGVRHRTPLSVAVERIVQAYRQSEQ